MLARDERKAPGVVRRKPKMLSIFGWKFQLKSNPRIGKALLCNKFGENDSKVRLIRFVVEKC
jgi:hypothetical protein